MPQLTTTAAPGLPAEVRERIILAADELYTQAGRQQFPTVDAVRRAARVDMNAASAAMREWRRAQTAQAAPPTVAVPESVAQANGVALAALWTQAQTLANETLQAAQAAWDAERAELDTVRQEIASAFEQQASELDQVKATAQAHQEAAQLAADALADLRTELAQAVSRAERTEARAEEIERRAADLRAELDRAHDEAEQAQQATVEARERAAELAGKLTTVQEQNATLLARLTPAAIRPKKSE